jgi:phosphoglycolate phosphatase
MFRIALLDFDGTMAATRPAVVACAKLTLATLGHGVPADDVITGVIARGLPLVEAFEALAGRLTPEETDRCVAFYRAHYPEIDRQHSVLFDDVAETLKALSRRGITVAILSNKGVPAIAAALAHFGIADLIPHIIGEAPEGPNKPDPAVFHERVVPLLRRRPAADYLMVGDTTTDLAFAKAAGIRSCWARYGYGDPEACGKVGYDFVIGSFGELARIGG